MRQPAHPRQAGPLPRPPLRPAAGSHPVAHLRLGLGRWPDSIGDIPDTPLFQMHTALVWIYFTALIFSLFAVHLAPGSFVYWFFD